MKEKPLKMIPGGGKVDEYKNLIKTVHEQLPDAIEHLRLIAKMTKAKYDALLKEGFSEEEALELSKTLFM